MYVSEISLFFELLAAKNNCFQSYFQYYAWHWFCKLQVLKNDKSRVGSIKDVYRYIHTIMIMIMFKIGGTMIILRDHFRQMHKIFSSCPPFRDLQQKVHNNMIMIMIVVKIDNSMIIICDHSWKAQNFFSSCHPLWSCLGLITSKLLIEIFFEKSKTLLTLLLGTAIRVHMDCHQGSGRKKHFS